jgi:hypothetical protein
VEVATGEHSEIILQGQNSETSWSIYESFGLSWSSDGQWLALMGTLIQNPSARYYDVLDGIFFLPVNEPTETKFWALSLDFGYFDLSPDGVKVVVTTVPQPWVAKNHMRVLKVPEEYP